MLIVGSGRSSWRWFDMGLSRCWKVKQRNRVFSYPFAVNLASSFKILHQVAHVIMTFLIGVFWWERWWGARINHLLFFLSCCWWVVIFLIRGGWHRLVLTACSNSDFFPIMRNKGIAILNVVLIPRYGHFLAQVWELQTLMIGGGNRLHVMYPQPS